MKYRLKQFVLRNSTIILLLLIGLLMGSSMVMLATQGAETHQLASNTAKLSENTNKIVKSQTDILNAIKQVTDDTKLTAQQQTTIIICMLQIPQEERSTDVQAACRKQADSQRVATSTSGSSAQGTSNSSAGQQGSSSNPTMPEDSSQHDNSQGSTTKPNRLERILEFINPFN